MPDMRASQPVTPLHIVKLGGSLITDQAGYCQLNCGTVDRFGSELAEALEGGGALPLVVCGGGSFGHGIALRYGLHRPDFHLRDLSRMTCGMHALLAEIATLWRAYGIDVFPIQASTLVTVCAGGLELNAGPIRAALARGLVPIMTGDMILSDPPRILSSDDIPTLVARQLTVGRVSFLSDVPGLLDRTGAVPALVRCVTLESAAAAVQLAGHADAADVTGGMLTKINAAVALLSLGVESLLADGRVMGMFCRVLGSGVTEGTRFARAQTGMGTPLALAESVA